jgi:type II secretory pathway component PulM
LVAADFNLTMPVMAGEFLLLMVFLDKFWFGPVGATLDARDAELRAKLALVKDNGSAVRCLRACSPDDLPSHAVGAITCWLSAMTSRCNSCRWQPMELSAGIGAHTCSVCDSSAAA